MFCYNCGKEIEDDSEFCYFCGSDTVNTEQVEFEEVGLFDKVGDSDSSFGETVDNLKNLMFANIDTETKVSGMYNTESDDGDDDFADEQSDDEYNLTDMRCHLCGSKVISGEIIADQGRDVFDMFADGTFIRDDEEVSIFGKGGMRIHLSGPACFCPRCKVVTGFFKAN